MKQPILLLMALLSLSGFGQQTVDCDSLRREQSKFTWAKVERPDSLLAYDIHLISNCLQLDAGDRVMLNSQSVALLIMHESGGNADLSYGDIMDRIQELRSSEEYRLVKPTFEFLMQYGDSLISKADSLKVREVFKGVEGLVGEQEELLAAIFSPRYKKRTYKEAITDFIASKEPKRESRANTDAPTELLFGHFKYMDDLEQLRNSGKDKPGLLYFTGWGDINGRKMEEALFRDDEVKAELANFKCFIGFADDRSRATDMQKQSFPDKDIQTKGQYITEIEKTLFSSDQRPILLVVDSNFNVVEIYRYNKDKQLFIEFLKRNGKFR